MRNEPSSDPRDQALRAALHDAAALAAIVAGEFHATYDGADRAEYLQVLGAYVTDLGGTLEESPGGPRVVFDGREITVRFGPGRGAR